MLSLRLAGIVVLATLAATTPVTTHRELRSGLDLSSLDRSARPQDDFYRFANGGWLDRTRIPADRVSHGLFTELADRVELDLRRLIESLDGGGEERQIRDLYASILNEKRIEARGVEPIREELAGIAALQSVKDLSRRVGLVTSLGDAVPFATSAGVDPSDSTALIVTVSQGGTLLPDRRYYVEDTAYERDVRARYVEYLTRIFALAALPYTETDARAVLALETRLARAQQPTARARSGVDAAIYRLNDLHRQIPGFDWREWAKPQGFDAAAKIVLQQPDFFREFSAAVTDVPLQTWKAWLAARYITAVAIYIPNAFGDARFDFFGKYLTGQEAPRDRWKRGVSLVNSFLGDALGRRYVVQHFQERTRVRVQEIVRSLLAAFRIAIEEAEWMKPATRKRAREKLDALGTRIGSPTRWRSYDGLHMDPGDLVGNVRRGRQFENAYFVDRLRRPFEPGQWLMSPQTINAYYTPSRNEIILPAAMLQPPLFDPDAEDAANYGSLGAVIGHEISHAFDARGRRFDAFGRLTDGWTEADEEQYWKRARLLVAQFNGYTPLPGVWIDGELTLGESLGDLAGLAVAVRAYRLSLKGRPAPIIDGFTGEQRLLIKWAQTWREHVREEYLRQNVLSSPYAPSRHRAEGAATNLDAFYDAFDVKPGDKLYRQPALRVRIW